MKESIAYVASVHKSLAAKTSPDKFDESLELYNKGEYLASLHAALDFFDTEIRYTYDDELAEQSKEGQRVTYWGALKSIFSRTPAKEARAYGGGRRFTVPNGSIIVSIEITDTEFSVRAPFVSLPEGAARLPLMRRAAELNLSDLDLVHFALQGDELYFNFRCPLELTHPHKIIYMIREMCIIGDKYDDEFISKFGAKRLVEPRLTPFSSEEMRHALTGIRETCRETIAAIDEYVNERKFGVAWFYLSIGLFKISYIARPQGVLDAQLDEIVERVWNDDETPQQVVDGREFLQKLLDAPDETISQSLYFVNLITSPRRNFSLSKNRSSFNETFDNVLNSGDPQEKTMRLLQMIYRIYFYNDIPDELHRHLSAALEKAGSKPFEQSASILMRAVRPLIESAGEE